MDAEKKHLAMFDGRQIRRHWDDKSEKWYFSVVDVVGVLSDSIDPRNYWKVLKNRLIEEGSSQTVTNCNQLKMIAEAQKIISSFDHVDVMSPGCFMPVCI